jgi:hypothetical protein
MAVFRPMIEEFGKLSKVPTFCQQIKDLISFHESGLHGIISSER